MRKLDNDELRLVSGGWSFWDWLWMGNAKGQRV